MNPDDITSGTYTGAKITIDGKPIDSPTALDATRTWTATISLKTIDPIDADVRASFDIERTAAREIPMAVMVARYSEADAALGRALVTGEPVGGNVAHAYAGSTGVVVTSASAGVTDPGAIRYTLESTLVASLKRCGFVAVRK